MKPRFFLIRHGKAEKGSGPDAERRLTHAGRDQVRQLFRALGPQLSPAQVRTSPLVRARETAEILAAETGAALAEDGALAAGHSSGRKILALGKRSAPGTALVGHNPEMAEAIAIGSGRGEAEMPPGTVAAFDAQARLLWLRSPSK